MRFSYAEAMCDPSHYLPLARAVEDAGYTSFTIADSICYPEVSDSTYPYTPDGNREFLDGKPFIEPFVLMSAMAAVTTKLRFTTFVVKLPIRNPVLIAKQAASLAVMSNNRFVFGVGSSPWPEDFIVTGTDWKTRGPRMNEMIDITTTRTEVHLRDPGVHAVGISLKRLLGLRVLYGDGLARQFLELIPAHQLVDLDGAIAEKFGQPALRGAAQHGHLPQAILRMGKAKRIEHIRVIGGKDMRHIVIVAHDFHRPGNALQREILVIIGQRARQEPVADQRRQHRNPHEDGDNADEPAEKQKHGDRP